MADRRAGRRQTAIVSAIAAALLLAACRSDDADDGVTTATGVDDSGPVTAPTTTPAPTIVPSPTAPPPTLGTVPDLSLAPVDVAPTPASGSLFVPGDIDEALASWIVLATDDLAARLATDADAIEPSSAVLVVWPDTSLGCPAPDVAYATVSTDGALIELRVGTSLYRYHAGGSAEPFLCDVPLTTPPTRLPG
jgi:hypothetical protein